MSHGPSPFRRTHAAGFTSRTDHVFADVRAQDLGNVDPAVGPLVVLQDHDQGPAEGDGRAVERVDEPRSLLARRAIADIQPARLVIGAVRGAGHLAVFAVLAAAGHPGFEVELAVGRPAQVARADVEHAIGNAQRLEQVFLDRQHLGVDRARGFRRAEGEHLDLGELVDAVKPAAGPAGGAGLGPEAMRQPDVLDGQVRLVEDLVGVHSAQRDLGGADQAEVGVLDRVDLRFDPARREPDPLQDTDYGPGRA